MTQIRFRKRYPTFPTQYLESIAKILADTDLGLKGSEIERALAGCNIPDVDPGLTKWKRLYNAFAIFQNEHQVGNHVIVFIQHVMHPASHTADTDLFYRWRDNLNRVLSLSGMEVGNDGKIKWVKKATDLDEAVARANRLKSALEQRQVHVHVLDHCRAEVLANNYFHAVLEAMKSITTRIRLLSNLDGDGAGLVQKAFAGDAPMLMINAFDTESRRGEQRGFVSLLTGLYGMVRNPVAHEAKIEWDMTERDALDVMTTISLIHRKLDRTEELVKQSK